MSGVSFDRAAEYYDATRGHPLHVSEKIADSVQARLPKTARLLDVGVGTGRITRPLLARGFQATGIDLSVEMMKRLLAQLPAGQTSPALALADATWLPFPTHTFEAVIAVHVFHLIGEVDRALSEIQRVLTPHGVLLAGHDERDPTSIRSVINERWRAIMAEHGVNKSSTRQSDPGLLWDELSHRAAIRSESIEAAAWETEFIPRTYLQNLAAGLYSSAWQMAPERLPECAAELHRWAIEEIGDLDTPRLLSHSFTWRIIHFTDTASPVSDNFR